MHMHTYKYYTKAKNKFLQLINYGKNKGRSCIGRFHLLSSKSIMEYFPNFLDIKKHQEKRCLSMDLCNQKTHTPGSPLPPIVS